MPTDSDRIPDKLLQELLISQEIDKIVVDDLLGSFEKIQPQDRISPSIEFSVDPRCEEPIAYNPARAKRPHDYSDQKAKKIAMRDTCPICAGKTTGILDLANLGEGYTFINGNLFPVIYPPKLSGSRRIKDHNLLWGLHLVQWTSSLHDQDWHNLAEEDAVIVMSRLAAAEKKLLSIGREIRGILGHENEQAAGESYISIIKNLGSAVGGSLEHGHQQILLSNLPPRRLLDNQRFEKGYGITFSEHLQASNPSELLLRDYSDAVLLVSQYMRRPLEMILALKDTNKSYLHQLDKRELVAVSRGWMDATRVLNKMMPDFDREIAYNVVTHNGQGAGLYFEFLPYTQEQGGFEQLGLSVCQSSPKIAADDIRSVLKASSNL